MLGLCHRHPILILVLFNILLKLALKGIVQLFFLLVKYSFLLVNSLKNGERCSCFRSIDHKIVFTSFKQLNGLLFCSTVLPVSWYIIHDIFQTRVVIWCYKWIWILGEPFCFIAILVHCLLILLFWKYL